MRRATAPRCRRYLYNNKIDGTIPSDLCDVNACYVKSGNNLVAPCGSADCCDLDASTAPIDSTVGVFGECYNPASTTELRVPPRPRRPARRATDPRRRRYLDYNQITGPIPTEIGKLAALTRLRVPPASPTLGAARD